MKNDINGLDFRNKHNKGDMIRFHFDATTEEFNPEMSIVCTRGGQVSICYIDYKDIKELAEWLNEKIKNTDESIDSSVDNVMDNYICK